MKRKSYVVVAIVLISGSFANAAVITSTFDTGPEGWRQFDHPQATGRIDAIYPVQYAPTGGNPGGLIWAQDPSGWGWTFGAPDVYLGDKQYAVGGVASFDLATSDTVASESIFWLRGPSMLMVYTASKPVTNAFTHYEVPLGPDPSWTAFQLDPSGNLINSPFSPNSDDFLATMSALVSVEVRGDWINGNELTWLDNFSFPAAPVPAPGAIVLAGFGMGLVCRLRRHRMI
jgi:hypothetical protein